MSKYQKSSLERIKLWLDIPFYMQYLESEDDLDGLILGCGLQEDDLIKESLSNKTTDIGSINPAIMSEVDWTHKDTIYKRDGRGNYIAKEVTTYHYSVPKRRCISLIRAILNRYNPDLAVYGYTLYAMCDDIGDFYVRFNDNYSLSINFHAYMTGDNDTVRAGIYTGLDNITSCAKKLNTKHHNHVLSKLKKSDVYKKILKL